jgi:hypothetical protein
MTEIERLEKAIKDLHGVSGQHAGSVAVHEKFEGKTVWQGIVEVFEIKGHPQARFAYAWSYKADNGEQQFVTVLGMPPVSSAQDAVRAYIASQALKKSP